MPGKTGKRAKPPTPCVDCGMNLRGQAFYRDGKKDRCTGCGERHIKEKFMKSPTA